MMKRFLLTTIWSFCFLLLCGSSFGLLCVGMGAGGCAKYSGIVVVGKLSDIETNKFTITCNKPKTGMPFVTHFDAGVIKNPKVLKGILNGSVYVAFPSGGQGTNAFRPCFHGFAGTPHSEGEEGIWLLTLDDMTGYCIDTTLKNPWPLSDEDEVVRALK